jgi:FHA domain
MSIACPNGHASSSTDYCDTCGARITGAPSTAAPGSSTPPMALSELPPAVAVAPPPAPSGPPVTCPHCEITQDSANKYCEACGFDFANGTAPVPLAAPVSAAVTWEAVASADAAYHARSGAADVPFPAGAPERRFALNRPQELVGRKSDARGIHPEIDLASPPEDTAISRSHCTLVRQPNGSYAVVDNGSTNGTFVNDSSTPLVRGVAVTLAEGDRLYLGAFTRITLRVSSPTG